MSEEACRTRSQKRALDPDLTEDDVESKKMKMERAPSELTVDGDTRVMPESGVGPAQGLLRTTETTATGSGEGLVGDGPVDMRTSHSDIKSEKRPPSPDVIVLSDSEQPSSPRVNGLTTASLKDTSTEALLKSSPEERERMIKQLKEELRLEEAKLVLLKKLRQSQIQKEAIAQKPAASSGTSVTTPPPLVRGTQNIPAGKTSLQTSSARMPGSIIPPPLVRGGQQVSAKLGPQASSQVVMPPLVRGAQIHNVRQHPSTGPPPLLLAPRASVPSMQIQGQRIIQQGLIRVANVSNTSLLVNIPQPTAASLKGTTVASAQVSSTPTSVASVVASVESPASRQAAAKLALRKQLEKTLLEIPPPKPPAPEMNFLPSAANNEFIYLVGLEEVVQNLLETQAGRISASTASAVLSREPYMCVQCKTDFTCRWREKGGAVMCETCMTSNQKKALKVEHTSRLKAAFVKALQQEQEMEQRLLQQGVGTASTKAEAAAPHPTLKQVIKPRRKLAFRSGEARDWSNGAVLQASSQLSRGSATTPRGVLHTFSQSPKLQNAASATALVSRTGRHSERAVGTSKGTTSNWKKTPLSTGGTLAFVSPSLAMHKTSSAVDRQREYLLDMIPPRSIPQSATWK
ncbi:transcriptional repressor p66-alpha isoform X1 [Alexandromys fortis]|uniref:transcriptional repressor p66-alpha isoform X1 n=1 Tax=Alexandromys fortis TaxID=100897 RepID=UPI0021522770|nr:transcriptional repressor p66-alpha isoform X1 [Microtus fortis]XP_049987645.1 transcriptional repressor p66-alpha isoform X1 [Microtus fortis]XP_049987646.1 transcriptional repressor p66-alpha isoform X1 [Microtus fortis]XP_049987647.1 transcriptional repressor p66-alpha isoform X1 [Microtus fortis]XP_049987648.1 transcriptional repressor p66-alpha isoform X1 [Microtus fortis]XP_049987649.1 transcriptional repressor p66-alpha isoform X1 [Microtus fortis]